MVVLRQPWRCPPLCQIWLAATTQNHFFLKKKLNFVFLFLEKYFVSYFFRSALNFGKSFVICFQKCVGSRTTSENLFQFWKEFLVFEKYTEFYNIVPNTP